MGYKKLSEQQEKQLIEEYKQGISVNSLMTKYGYKTKKSITDKIKKYYPDQYDQIIEQARNKRRGYTYSLEKINNAFDAYLVGLLLTDGYLLSDRDGLGLDMCDEDVIKFVAESIGTTYKTYPQSGNRQTKYRVLINVPGIQQQVARFGIIKNKTLTIPKPQLLEEEKVFIPYIIRGIIDGDGCVTKTSYGSPQFYIVTMSKDFAEWIKEVLTTNLFMEDIHIRQREQDNIYKIDTANQYNIFKLIAIVYNKPFGMFRKYSELRKTFRDYNKDFFIEEKCIVQTPTI